MAEPLDFPKHDPVPITPARVARALVDGLGGYEAGWGLWVSALGKLEQALVDARDNGRNRFCAFPPGELRRLLTDVEDALELASTAVEIQLAVNEEPETTSPKRRTATIAAVLHERAAELARRRAEV